MLYRCSTMEVPWQELLCMDEDGSQPLEILAADADDADLSIINVRTRF